MSSFESTLKDFLSHSEKLTEELYLKEFMSLKAQSQKYKENGTYPAEAGQQPFNKKKNRFKDILPFEYTRVSLHPIEGIEGSDYINANYITGPDDEVTYIAAQGPLPNTVCDFWRMLWYHSIEIVVMACRLIENAKNKCEHYWPEKNCTREFEGITVTTIAEENKTNDFVVRDFLAECGGEQQYIRQYHYTAWPDHGKPQSSEPIVQMLEMVHSYRKRTEVPLLFHCSAGCGRTGTMVAIDTARTMFLSKSVPDKFTVHRLVEKMRTQRPSMVQAKDQYQFVYEVVGELARRALGSRPTLPTKPSPSNKTAGSSSSECVYENAHTTPHSKPFSSSISETNTDRSDDTLSVSVAPPRTRASYENIDGKNLVPPSRSGGGGNSQNNSPAPSPPISKRPMVKQRSTTHRKLSSDDSPENSTSQLYGNLHSTPDKADHSPSPPRPKPRVKSKDRVTNDNNLASKSSNPVRSPLIDGTVSEGTTNEATTPTPRKALPPTPQKTSPPANQKPLPPPPQKALPPTPQKALPPTPQKALPPTPQKPRGTRGKTPVELPSTTPPLTSTPGKPNSASSSNREMIEDEDPYSSVDMSQVTDTGPSIDVIDEHSGRKAPLEKIEKQLDISDHLDTSKSSSIMDTLLSLVGDDIIKEVEDEEERLPTPPPIGRRTMSMLDEVPPEIPRRTVASLELVAEDKEPESLGQYDVVKEDVGGVGTYDVVQDHGRGDVGGVVYEAPTPLSIPIISPPLSADRPTKSSSMEFPQTGPSSSGALASTSTATSVATMNRSPAGGGGLSAAKSTKNKLSNLFKKSVKSDKKKVSLNDISGPVGGAQKMGGSQSSSVVRSPSDLTTSSVSTPSTSSRASPSHSITSGTANSKYSFPGDLGYGIRICKPIGPRQEPHGWKVRVLTNSVA